MTIEEDISKVAQDCFENCPTIILGSGASMSYGLPNMEVLGKYLCDNLEIESDSERESWHLVKSELANNNHLESVLEGKTLPDTLLSKIVALTWRCVNEKDRKLFDKVVLDDKKLELGELLLGMFNSTQTKLHVVTTNYDRVAEYACNSMGLLFQTGFSPGYVQEWEGSNERVRYLRGPKATRVVNIWKVHGSLDWFRTANERIIGLPVFELPSERYIPLIVTPGLNKFEKTHEDPFRTIINGADAALKDASAFLCVGFGFRDKHIYPKIVERCRDRNVPIVVLAMMMTEETRRFLKYKAGDRYLGIEQAGEGSKVYSPENPCGVQVDKLDLWSLPNFNRLVL